MVRILCSIITLITLVISSATIVHADCDYDFDRGNDCFDRGVRLYETGSFRYARNKFQEAVKYYKRAAYTSCQGEAARVAESNMEKSRTMRARSDEANTIKTAQHWLDKGSDQYRQALDQFDEDGLCRDAFISAAASYQLALDEYPEMEKREEVEQRIAEAHRLADACRVEQDATEGLYEAMDKALEEDENSPQFTHPKVIQANEKLQSGDLAFMMDDTSTSLRLLHEAQELYEQALPELAGEEREYVIEQLEIIQYTLEEISSEQETQSAEQEQQPRPAENEQQERAHPFDQAVQHEAKAWEAVNGGDYAECSKQYETASAMYRQAYFVLSGFNQLQAEINTSLTEKNAQLCNAFAEYGDEDTGNDYVVMSVLHTSRRGVPHPVDLGSEMFNMAEQAIEAEDWTRCAIYMGNAAEYFEHGKKLITDNPEHVRGCEQRAEEARKVVEACRNRRGAQQ